MKKIKPGKGLLKQIADNAPIYVFDQKWLTKLMRSIDGTSKRNRCNALAKNRKNRWSQETRDKYVAIKQEKWLEEQRQLLIQNKV